MRKFEVVMLFVMMAVFVVVEAWLKHGPWYLPPAFFLGLGVCAVLVVAMRAQGRVDDLGRDPDERPCTNCRYDLRGNVSGRCPECGTAVEIALPS